MKDLSNLEKYLQNMPLTPELEQLAKGSEGEDAPETVVNPDSREITEDDREHLRRLSFEPGWPVLLRLVDQLIQAKEDAAKKLSLSDPLTNRDRVASEWAYVAMLRKAKGIFVSMLEQFKRGQQ